MSTFVSTEIIVALIAFTGVVFSGLISWVVSRSQVATKIQSIRYEIQQVYAAKLHEERIQVYPELYGRLAEFTECIQAHNLSVEWLKDFYIDLCKWDAANAIFLSGHSNGLAYRFRRLIKQISITSSNALENRLADPEKRLQLIRKAWELEVALKNDIGIFQVEFYDPDVQIETYGDLAEGKP